MDSNLAKLESEQKLNLELEAEIHLWTFGDKEDLCVGILTELTRKNKLNYLSGQKKSSDLRLQTLLQHEKAL
jgi:hypothetical protein